MEIYRYSANNQLGYIRVEVDDDYQLQAGELKELPIPCYTPMKLVNGVLTSATQEESDVAAKKYLEENGFNLDDMSDETKEQMLNLSKQIITLKNDNEELNQKLTATQNQVMTLSKTILGGNE
nr:hypothetical protein [uncultured Ligilactobacillus sp.]